MTLGNPFGLLALVGIPVVLAIHFLQQRARPEVITTLFLIEDLPRPSTTGARIERLRTSIPLWLQLLAVLALTWLFADPRIPRANSVHRTVVVLDSSASMAAFKPAAIKSLTDTLKTLAPAAALTEYTLLPTAPGIPRLYGGTSSKALLRSAEENWFPALGTHDPTPTLRVARSLAGADGTVLYLTDHTSETALPAGALPIAVGTPTANTGFTGLTTEPSPDGLLWSALVRNYSGTPTSREWWLTLPNGSRSPANTIELPAAGTKILRAPFPEGAEKITLHLAPDTFPSDDTLPIVRPKPKPLSLHVDVPENLAKIFASFPQTTLSPTPNIADVRATTVTSTTTDAVTSGPAILLSNSRSTRALPFAKAPATAENHPLTTGLNFSGLLFQEVPNLPSTPTDEPLIWSGSRPLAFIRNNQLWFNFDLQKSNAQKLPATILLIHRYLEQIRSQKRAPTTINLGTGESLTYTSDRSPGAPEIEITNSPTPKKAPTIPTFFEVTQGDRALLTGATHFADAREADLTTAATSEPLTKIPEKLRSAHDAPHPLTKFLPIALLALFLLTWHHTAKQ